MDFSVCQLITIVSKATVDDTIKANKVVKKVKHITNILQYKE